MNELNILCAGEPSSGCSTFLEVYTSAARAESTHKIFVGREKLGPAAFPVFFHEIEEREGMEVYLKYSFDAILFFVRIDAFHNTASKILDCILQYSRINGGNVYKIPVSVVALSQIGTQQYNDIGYGDKQALCSEVSSIVEQGQIIFVESDRLYESRLSRLFKAVKKGEGKGVKESAYSNWYFKGIGSYFSCGQFKLAVFKLIGELKTHLNRRMKAVKGIKGRKLS